MYEVKSWGQFQHYGTRNPPWIKLYKNLLDDMDFMSLPVSSKALAPMLWLLAAEHENPKSGFIEGPIKRIAFRLRMSVSDLEEAVKPLIETGFIILASLPIAVCKQDARPETENREQNQRHKLNGGSYGKRKSFTEEGDRLAAKYRTQKEPVTLDAK